MVPQHLASEAIRLFMAIPKERIERETEEGLERYEACRQMTLRFYRTDEADMTAEQCAEFMHAGMVQACIAQRRPEVNEDVAYHLTGIAARGVALAAVWAAEQRGELGRLTKEMDRLREESGNDDFDELDNDQKPAEYLPLAEEAGGIMLRIEKMMVIDMLNRYGMSEQAEFFEADEEGFGERVQEGYYVLMPDKRPR